MEETGVRVVRAISSRGSRDPDTERTSSVHLLLGERSILQMILKDS